MPPPPPPPTATFTLVAMPSPLGIAPGTNSTVQVSLQVQNGFTSSVSVTVSGLASGITIQPSTFSLTPGGSSQQVVVSAQGNVAPGSYSAAIQGSGGGQSNTANLSIQVGQLATFSFIQPNSPDILARIGSSVQTQIGTQTCCPPAIGGYLLNLSIGALPPNVTASFSPNPVVVGNPTILTVTAASNAVAVQNLPFNVMATASAQVAPQQLGLTLDVTPQPGNLPNNRTDFIRMDGTPVSVAYDPMHQLIYASNLEWNRVDIISPTTKQIVRSVPIPTPLGLDISPDGSRVYVSSQTQRMFAIDTAKQQLIQSWSLPQSNAVPGVVNGMEYGVLQVVALSNGDALLLANQIFTTAVGLIKWNPATNSVSTLSLPPTFQIGGMSRSGDGTKVIIFGGSEPGAVVLYDAPSDTFTATVNFPFFVNSVQASPTGTRFVIFDMVGGLRLYDAQLNDLGPIPPGADDTGVVFSPDGSLIYVVADDHGVPAIYTVSTATLTLLGIAPAYATIPPHVTLDPPFIIEIPFAADSTGLIFGAADHGLALDDSTFFQGLNGTAGAPTFDKLLQPDTGPVNAATPVLVETAPFSVLPDTWFGAQHAIDEMLLGDQLQISAPPSSQPGPVNFKIIQPNGTQTFDPLAFSYGPAPLFVSGDTGSPEGSAFTDIIALGVPADPSAIQVSVGGANANVVSAKVFSSTFPTVDIRVQLPAGATGDADVKVTTAAGSATLPKAFRFTESVKDYASPDAFQAVTYDRFRNQLYLSAGDHVDVFSLASDQFIAPFGLPSAGGKKQFAGMALTPDGSQLIVANLMDGSVDIVNPDQPSAAVAVPIAPTFPGIDGPPCFIGPSYVAVTDTGKVFIAYGGLIAVNCGPGGPVYVLDLSTKAVNQLSTAVCDGQQSASFVSSSRDGSKVAMGGSISGAGGWCIYDAASNSYASSIFFQPYGAAIAGDGNIFAAGFRITDDRGLLLNIMAFPEPFYPGQLPGTPEGNGVIPQYLEKMNDSGSLLYVPFQNTVDIFDVPHAILRRRLTLSEQIPQILDALAIDPTGEKMFAITNAGLTVIELTAAPLSIGSVSPSAGTSSTVVKIRGSGFTAATTVSFNGTLASAKFVDADTLSVTVPPLGTGPVQLIFTNLDGQTYTLDDAFTVQ